MRKFNTSRLLQPWLQVVLLVCLISVTPFALSQSKTTKQKPVGQEPSATDSSTDTDSNADSGKKDHAKGKITNVNNTQQTSDTDSDSSAGKKKHGKAIVKTVSNPMGGTTTNAASTPVQPAPGKADTKNVADGAAKGQASEGVAPNPKGGGGNGGQNNGVAITRPIDKSSPLATMTPNGGGNNNTSAIEHKNISDGAAKSQAVDGMMQKPNGGGKSDGSTPSAKDLTILSGASKSQAVEGTLKDPNSGGKDTKGSGAGNVTFNPFSITKKIDKSSPQMMEAAPEPPPAPAPAPGTPSSAGITKEVDKSSPKLMESAPGTGNGKNNSTPISSVDGLEHSHETVEYKDDKAVKPHPVGGGGSDNPTESVVAQAPKGKSTTTEDQSTTDTTTKPATGEKKH